MVEVRLIRSARRQRSAAARREGNAIVVRVPAHLDDAATQRLVDQLVRRLEAQTSLRTSDADLMERARYLNEAYLEGRASIGSVQWSARQRRRWGSCTTATGDIRISERLREEPEYVLDAVLIHEMVHTFIHGHTKEFWQWADRAPQAERAKGYLEALARYGPGGDVMPSGS